MTWNVVHNFPGAKDTYQVPVDYPTVGYDTIIATWFTDIFTSILAMQDSLLDLVGKVLLLAGGTMTGDLTLKQDLLWDILSGEFPVKINFYDHDLAMSLGSIGVAVEEGALEIKCYDELRLYDPESDVNYLKIGGGVICPSPLGVVKDLGATGFEFRDLKLSRNIIIGGVVDGIKISLPVWVVDIEVSDKTKGLILKSPNDSRFRLEVSDGGVLSTEAL